MFLIFCSLDLWIFLVVVSVFSIVKPRYKHPRDKYILANKHAVIGPKRILVGPKHNLNFKHMLLIGWSRTKVKH